MIIQAIQLLAGKRFTNEILRTGTNNLVVEGVFKEGQTVTTIRRIFGPNGQSKSFINDEPIKRIELLMVTRKLVDLHGQHEHQNLLNVSSHIIYLDAFGKYDSDVIRFRKIHIFCFNS